MIECELCGRYTDVDDIVNCPECGMELCERCSQQHIKLCLIEEY